MACTLSPIDVGPVPGPGREAPEGPFVPRGFRVRHHTPETADTFTLELEALDGGGLPFAPGQFNMLLVPGVGEAPLSISGDPARPDVLVHTVRAVGPVTRALDACRRGAWVGVRGPFGTDWPVEAAHGHDVVIVAGGIGLAPLRPALLHVLAHRPLHGRVAVAYGARTPGDLLFARDLRDWRGRFDAEVEVTVDRADPTWRGGVGLVTRPLDHVRFDPESCVAFVCGPEIMIRFVTQALLAKGVEADQIHVSLERSMKCGIGLCGHCQMGPLFVCRDGPVVRLDRAWHWLGIREV